MKSLKHFTAFRKIFEILFKFFILDHVPVEGW